MFFEAEETSAILVVDPNPRLREQLDEIFNGSSDASLSRTASNLTYLFDGVDSCELAKEKIRDRLSENTPYHLIFVESQLMDGDGLELISELWQLDPDLHGVLCSADASLSWARIVETLGESDQLLFLQKPFSSLELRQIVHALLRKWQLGKQSLNVMRFMELQINQRTREIEEANRSLLQSEKLAAVGQLAAGIAHEINTPAQYVGDNIKAIGDFFNGITRLLDFYRVILNQYAQADHLNQIRDMESKEDLEFILEDAPMAIQQSLEGMGQIVRIVQAMKGFSHMGAGPIANINLNQALENTLLVAHNSYKPYADVVTEFGEIPAIECFPGELNQVFLNIIINAVHAIEDAGKGRGKITVITKPTENGVEVRIEDTGTGIPTEVRDNIYDPFFTTKDVGKGSGQGLNIAYRIITQQHGGSIGFETEAGVGTTFIINLPRYLPKVQKH